MEHIRAFRKVYGSHVSLLFSVSSGSVKHKSQSL
jgi:hypothetical protein